MQHQPWQHPDSFEQGANTVDDTDVQRVAMNVQSILVWMKRMRPLRRVLDDLTLLVFLVRDYWFGRYRKIPKRVVLTIVFGITYVLSPLDGIPDPTPFVGFVDDIAVITLLCLWAENDIHRYQQWRKVNQQEEQP